MQKYDTPSGPAKCGGHFKICPILAIRILQGGCHQIEPVFQNYRERLFTFVSKISTFPLFILKFFSY
jgi:hypothetical protein